MLKKETKFFKGRDVRTDGTIPAAFPQWYFRNHIERLERQIDNYRSVINHPESLPQTVLVARKEMQKAKEVVDGIRKSIPKLSAKEKDHIADFYKRAGQVLRDKMPTLDQMSGGHLDIRVWADMEQAKEINMIGYLDIVRACNRKAKNDKVSIKDLQVMWKICGFLLDEPTNIETVRRGSKIGGDVRFKDHPLADVESGKNVR